MSYKLSSEYRSTIRLICHETSSSDIDEIKRIIRSQLPDDEFQKFQFIWDFDKLIRDNHLEVKSMLHKRKIIDVYGLAAIRDLYSQLLRMKDLLDERWGYNALAKYLPK